MNLKELSAHIATEYRKRYGHPPRWIVAAPGRVNIIGGHTDYNDGFVLSMAIERYAIMAADTAIVPGKATIYDTQFKQTVTIDVSSPINKGSSKWSNYIRGVLAGFQNRGVRIPALNIAFLSTVPLGAGLSSSAALEACTTTLMEAATGNRMNPFEKTLLAQMVEHDFSDVPCGLMDRFASTLDREGHLILLDCRTHETKLVPLSDPSVALLIVNTNVKHECAGSEYAKRRAECESAAKILGVASLREATVDLLEKVNGKMSEVLYRRVRHVIGEVERTVHAAERVRQSNWPGVGSLMYANHASLRDYYDVSSKELDMVVKTTEAIGYRGGIYGCCMTGGGFGGCAVALVKTGLIETISRQIAACYKTMTNNEVTIFSSRPASGVTVIKS